MYVEWPVQSEGRKNKMADEKKQQEVDWQNKDLAHTNLHMFRNQIACDVDFNFNVHAGDHAKSTISAHSFMLISRSPVFEAMLTRDFKERETREVNIEDISRHDFKNLLTFMYSEKTKITEDNVQQLRYAANKYMIQSLSNQCSTFLESNINIKNVCVILENSIIYKDDVSAQRCLDFIANKATDVLKSKSFRKISKQSLKIILEMDSLNIQREDSVLEAARKWAHKQMDSTEKQTRDEDLRETLGDCLYQIRFGDLDPAALTKKVGLSGVLTDREFRLFGIYCHNRSDKDVKGDLEKLGFNLKPRQKRPNFPISYNPGPNQVHCGRS